MSTFVCAKLVDQFNYSIYNFILVTFSAVKVDTDLFSFRMEIPAVHFIINGHLKTKTSIIKEVFSLNSFY